jgi:heme-degrading monooxygenase HmoA
VSLLPGAVSIHKFTAGRLDRERLAGEIAAFVEDTVSTLPGLRRVTVLSEYGGRHVAIVAEWETHEAWAAGVQALYADPRLKELSAATGQATNEAYTPVSVVRPPP